MNSKRNDPVFTRTDLGYSVARSGGFEIASHTMGALPVLNAIMQRMKLEEFLEAYLPPPDQRSKITVAQGLLLLVRNILVAREPIYGVGEWAEQHAPDLLGLFPRQIHALNDDRVGRCLNQLFKSDYSSMVLALVGHVVKEFGLDLDQLHNDSTTVTFFGKYERATKGATKYGKPTLAITYGHNKDHRRDLKQLLFILTVTHDGGVPIYFTAGDGNLTDDKTHQDTWDLLCKIVGRQDFLYVGDSKLATSENMKHIHDNGGRFVSVLPRTRKEDTDFRELLRQCLVSWKQAYRKIEEVLQPTGEIKEEVVDVFLISEHPVTTAEGFRLLWFHSARKEELDAVARGNKINRALHELAELRESLRSPRSRLCRDRDKVKNAVRKILEKPRATRWIHVALQEQQDVVLRQEKRGRPGKNTKYKKTTKTRFDISYEIDTVKQAEDSLSDGIFPLVTNDTELSDKDVLLAYKGQPIIEKRFSQLKSDFEVASVYLKDAGRIEALLCVYFIAMLVQALLERELRLRMEEKGIKALPLYPERRMCRAPSSRRLIDLFDNIQRHQMAEDGKLCRTFVTDLSRVQKRVLTLLKMRAVYEV